MVSDNLGVAKMSSSMELDSIDKRLGEIELERSRLEADLRKLDNEEARLITQKNRELRRERDNHDNAG
jgi:predicted nuclease with TOPRIM domain